MIEKAKLFPDITVPGFLLDTATLDDLIDAANEQLDENGPDGRLAAFIEQASALRAVHDGTFSLGEDK